MAHPLPPGLPSPPPGFPGTDELIDIIAHMKKYEQLNQIKKITSLCIGTSIVLANIIVIITYRAMGTLRNKITNYVIFTQTFVDLLIAFTTFLDLVGDYNKMLTFSAKYELVKVFFFDYTNFLALGILLMTSLERFAAIKLPLWHLRIMTKNKIILGTVSVWVTASAPPLCYIFASHRWVHTEAFLINFKIITMSIVLIGIIMVITCLIMTYATIRLSLGTKLKLTANIGQNKRHIKLLKAENKKERKLIMFFLTIGVVYAVTFLPYCVARLATNSDALSEVIFWDTSTELYFSSALFNPIFTLIMKDDFRGVVTNVFATRCRWIRQGLRRKEDKDVTLVVMQNHTPSPSRRFAN